MRPFGRLALWQGRLCGAAANCLTALRRTARVRLLAALLYAAGAVEAHDLITAEVADAYLATVSRELATYKSAAPAPRRAAAAYQVGRTLDEVREYLNRDIASHGRVQGLASNRLVLELQARGAPLKALSDGRYAANLAYYRDALALSPKGAHEADSLFRLVHGYFYDSFRDDPLSPLDASWPPLKQQIDFAERLVGLQPPHAEQEEARFILLIHYLQAVRAAPKAGVGREYARKAQRAMAEFEKQYPDSLRTAALPALRERLPDR